MQIGRGEDVDVAPDERLARPAQVVFGHCCSVASEAEGSKEGQTTGKGVPR